jgi:hypothetical protein
MPTSAKGQKKCADLRHATVPCAGFRSVVAVLRYAAQQRRSMPADSRASIGVVTTPSYGETAYYYAVSDRWFGLGDYVTDQPGRIMAIWRERSVELRFSTSSSIARLWLDVCSIWSRSAVI